MRTREAGELGGRGMSRAFYACGIQPALKKARCSVDYDQMPRTFQDGLFGDGSDSNILFDGPHKPVKRPRTPNFSASTLQAPPTQGWDTEVSPSLAGDR